VGVSFNLSLLLFFLFVLAMPLIFFKVWVPVWFGHSSARFVADVTKRELAVFLLLTLLTFGLGLWPSLLFIV
jgi:hypothetical protein